MNNKFSEQNQSTINRNEREQIINRLNLLLPLRIQESDFGVLVNIPQFICLQWKKQLRNSLRIELQEEKFAWEELGCQLCRSNAVQVILRSLEIELANMQEHNEPELRQKGNVKQSAILANRFEWQLFNHLLEYIKQNSNIMRDIKENKWWCLTEAQRNQLSQDLGALVAYCPHWGFLNDPFFYGNDHNKTLQEYLCNDIKGFWGPPPTLLDEIREKLDYPYLYFIKRTLTTDQTMRPLIEILECLWNRSSGAKKAPSLNIENIADSVRSIEQGCTELLDYLDDSEQGDRTSRKKWDWSRCEKLILSINGLLQTIEEEFIGSYEEEADPIETALSYWGGQEVLNDPFRFLEDKLAAVYWENSEELHNQIQQMEDDALNFILNSPAMENYEGEQSAEVVASLLEKYSSSWETSLDKLVRKQDQLRQQESWEEDLEWIEEKMKTLRSELLDAIVSFCKNLDCPPDCWEYESWVKHLKEEMHTCIDDYLKNVTSRIKEHASPTELAPKKSAENMLNQADAAADGLLAEPADPKSIYDISSKIAELLRCLAVEMANSYYFFIDRPGDRKERGNQLVKQYQDVISDMDPGKTTFRSMLCDSTRIILGGHTVEREVALEDFLEES